MLIAYYALSPDSAPRRGLKQSVLNDFLHTLMWPSVFFFSLNGTFIVLEMVNHDVTKFKWLKRI